MLLKAPDKGVGMAASGRAVGRTDRKRKERVLEKIVDGKDVDGCTVYEVKWKGAEDTEWILWSLLRNKHSELVEAYERSKGADTPGEGKMPAKQARARKAGAEGPQAATSGRARQLRARPKARTSISPERGQGDSNKGKKPPKRRLTKKAPTTTPARTHTHDTATETTPHTTPDPKRARGRVTYGHNDPMHMTDSPH